MQFSIFTKHSVPVGTPDKPTKKSHRVPGQPFRCRADKDRFSAVKSILNVAKIRGVSLSLYIGTHLAGAHILEGSRRFLGSPWAPASTFFSKCSLLFREHCTNRPLPKGCIRIRIGFMALSSTSARKRKGDHRDLKEVAFGRREDGNVRKRRRESQWSESL